MALENKLGITDSAQLAREEEKISKAKAKELFESGILDSLHPGTYVTLARIHEFLFDEIYDFAGKMRTVNIAKGNFRFAPVMYLRPALESIDAMPQSSFDEIIEKYVEMNVAHPFREGNGRSTLIDIRYIDNIVRMQHITRVPKVPAYLKGVINLRGEVLPVMSLRLKMGLEADEMTRATRIIILKQEQQGSVGIIVDEVKEVVTLGTSQIEKMSQNTGEIKKSFITGVGKHNGELISLLDLNSITLEENA